MHAHSGLLEPDAVKAARPVRRGADGKGSEDRDLAGGPPYGEVQLRAVSS
jgi:hypothetical protein